MFSLEPQSDAIPLGRYQVRMTVSGRATRGTLFSPDAAHRLPILVDVPGRSAIRIHSGNQAQDSQGCILVGMGHTESVITRSQAALRSLMASIGYAPGETWITVTTMPKQKEHT